MNWYKFLAGTVLGAALIFIIFQTMGFLHPRFALAILVVVAGSLPLHFVTSAKWVEFWAGVTFGSSLLCLKALPFGEGAIGPWLFPIMVVISIVATFLKKFLHDHAT